MTYPIIDLHCDLLSYLEGDPNRTPYHPEVGCSIPQLKAGNVKLQTLAVFTKTRPDSVQKGTAQFRLYQELAHRHFDMVENNYAIENASSFCSEEEPLSAGLKRLHSAVSTIGKPLYISLTWNDENRFGGGILSKAGLKKDGQLLLDEMHALGIAVDLSHTSDALAYEIIEYIDGKNLNISLLASHSNARMIKNHLRNLPDELAKEIMRRQGVIGLNFYSRFVGETDQFFVKHLAHWLELGGENHIVLGADFFYDPEKGYLPGYQDASCYERLFQLLKKELKLHDSILEKLAHKNAQSFINRTK